MWNVKCEKAESGTNRLASIADVVIAQFTPSNFVNCE